MEPDQEPRITEEGGPSEEIDEAEQERKRKERKERAVKEREDKVKAERGRLEAEIGRSRMGLNKEEGEREFMCAWKCLLIYSSCSALSTRSFCLRLQEYVDGCDSGPTGTNISFERTLTDIFLGYNPSNR